MKTSPAPRSETLQGRTARWTTLWLGRRGANAAKNQPALPGVVISNTLATVWISYRGSVVKCARSQVRPFNEDDEAAHEHVTEHMRDLGERLLHERDFSYEDITGHEELPMDLPTPGEDTATRHQKTRWRRTTGCGPRISKTYARKNQTDQPTTTIGFNCKS